ncbi:MAG TPA: glutamate formimidoyltransferase [Chthonomonadaceae bacterium]|nr:glutamate formimidoyltransferase [Chthonomonadaceae bacterium]
MEPIFQCVPNFSEGRRPEVVQAIADAIAATPGARLIDHSADADHNRCVMTFLGPAEAIRAAALAAARVAVARIDMRIHTGVHPRTGAIDVLPVIPLWNATREQAIALAHALGSDLASELALPVYFYEWAAVPGRPAALPDVRRGGLEAFAHLPLIGAKAPDLGPAEAHPTAGIVLVGARGPLVAYNVNLDTPDVQIARAIARRIRQERDTLPELAGVRALGLFLASRNCAQVSMNLTRPEQSPLPAVFAFVQAEAARRGVSVRESEIIGAIPEAALGGVPPAAILWKDYKPGQILETWKAGH